MADWDDEEDDVPQQKKYVPPGKRGGGGGWGGSFGGPRKGRWDEEEVEEDDWGRPKPSQAATSSVVKDEWDDSDDEDESPPKTNNTSSKTKEPIKKKGKGKKGKFKNKKIGQDDEFDVDNASEKKDGTSQKGVVDADDAFLGGEVDESSSKVKKENTPEEEVVQQIINQTVNLDDFKLTTQDSIEDFAEKVGTKIAREVQSEILVLAFLKELLRTSTKKMKKESLLKVTQMSRAIYNEKTSGKKSKKKQSKAKKVDVRGKAGANADFVDFQESRYDDFDMF